LWHIPEDYSPHGSITLAAALQWTSSCQPIYDSTALVDLRHFFSVLILYTVDATPWAGISPSQGRYVHTEQHKHRIKRTQTSMSPVGFEPTIPVFRRAKTVHALDRAATVIGEFSFCKVNITDV
jgi:hypothetical protein